MRLFSGANLREISQSTLWDYFAEAIFLWASQEPASLVAEQLSSRESDPFIRCSVSAGAILPSLHFFSFILPDDIVIFRFFFGLSLRYFEQYCPSREACASFGIRYDQFRLVRLSCFSRFSFLFFCLFLDRFNGPFLSSSATVEFDEIFMNTFIRRPGQTSRKAAHEELTYFIAPFLFQRFFLISKATQPGLKWFIAGPRKGGSRPHLWEHIFLHQTRYNLEFLHAKESLFFCCPF